MGFVWNDTEHQVATAAPPAGGFVWAGEPITDVRAQPAAVPAWVGRPLFSPIDLIPGGDEYLNLVQRNSESRMGFIESIGDWTESNIPFAGDYYEAEKLYRIIDITKKLNAGWDVSDDDLLYYNIWRQREARLGNAKTFGKVGEVLKNQVKFWIEIAGMSAAVLSVAEGIAGDVATIGGKTAGQAAKKTATAALSQALKGQAARQAYGQTLARGRDLAATGIQTMVKKIIGREAPAAAVRTFANAAAASADIGIKGAALTLTSTLAAHTPQRAIAERRLANVLEGRDEDARNAVIMGIADAWTEYASEMAGVHLGRATVNLAGKLGGPGAKRFADLIIADSAMKLANAKYGIRSLDAFAEYAAGIGAGGIYQEFMEERLGGFLRGFYGGEGIEGRNRIINAIDAAWPTWKQAKTELIAFSIPGLVGKGTAYALRPRVQGPIKIQTEMDAARESGVLLESLDGLHRKSEEEDSLAPLVNVIERQALQQEDAPEITETVRAFNRALGAESQSETVRNWKRELDLINVYNSVIEANPGNPTAMQQARDAVRGTLEQYLATQRETATLPEAQDAFDALIGEQKASEARIGDAPGAFEYVLNDNQDLTGEDVSRLRAAGRVTLETPIEKPANDRMLRLNMTRDLADSWNDMSEARQNGWVGMLGPIGPEGRLYDDVNARRIAGLRYEALRRTAQGLEAENIAPVRRGDVVTIEGTTEAFVVEGITEELATLKNARGLRADKVRVADLRKVSQDGRVVLANRTIYRGTRADFANMGIPLREEADPVEGDTFAVHLDTFIGPDGDIFISADSVDMTGVEGLARARFRLHNRVLGLPGNRMPILGQALMDAVGSRIEETGSESLKIEMSTDEGRFNVYQKYMLYNVMGHQNPVGQTVPFNDDIRALGIVDPMLGETARREFEGIVGLEYTANLLQPSEIMPVRAEEARVEPRIAPERVERPEVGVGIAPLAEAAEEAEIAAPEPAEVVGPAAEQIVPEEVPEAEDQPSPPPEPVKAKKGESLKQRIERVTGVKEHAMTALQRERWMYRKGKSDGERRVKLAVESKREEVDELRESVRQYILNAVPKPEQGKLLTRAIRVKTKNGAEKVFRDAKETADRYEKREAIREFKDLKKKTKVDQLRPPFQELAAYLFDIHDERKMTPAKQRQLESRLQYLRTGDDPYREFRMPTVELEEIGRLSQESLASMETDQIWSLINRIKSLVHQSKLATSLKQAGREREWAATEAEMLAAVEKIVPGVEPVPSGEEPRATVTAKYIEVDSTTLDSKAVRLDGKRKGVWNSVLNEPFHIASATKLRPLEFEIWDALGRACKEAGVDATWSRLLSKRGRDVERISYTLESGEEIQITKGERLDILMHSRAKYNTEAMLAGGIILKVNPTRKLALSADDVIMIMESASAEEKLLADALRNIIDNVITPRLNETSLELWGYEVAREPDYWNITRGIRDVRAKMPPFVQATLEGLGIWKPRKGGGIPVVIEDAFSRFLRTSRLSAMYQAYAVPIAHARRVFASPELEATVTAKMGPEYWNGLKEHIDNIEDVGRAVSRIETERSLQGLYGNVVKEILYANPAVVAKQVPSYVLAELEVGLDAWRAGFSRMTDAEVENMYRRSAEIRYRALGMLTREMGEVAEAGLARRVLLGQAPLVEVLGRGIRKADMWVIRRIWKASEAWVKANAPDLAVGSDAYWNAVARKAEEVVRLTQPTFDTKDRSLIGAERTLGWRLITAFSTQRNKNYNIGYRAFVEYQNSEQNVEDARKLGNSVAVLMLLNAAAIAAVDGLRDAFFAGPDPDDKEKEFEWTNGLLDIARVNAGLLYIIGPVLEGTINVARGKWNRRGGNVLLSTAEELQDAVVSTLRAVKYGISEEPKDKVRFSKAAGQALRRVIAVGGKVYGVPLRNIMNYSRGVYQWIAPEAEKGEAPYRPAPMM